MVLLFLCRHGVTKLAWITTVSPKNQLISYCYLNIEIPRFFLTFCTYFVYKWQNRYFGMIFLYDVYDAWEISTTILSTKLQRYEQYIKYFVFNHTLDQQELTLHGLGTQSLLICPKSHGQLFDVVVNQHVCWCIKVYFCSFYKYKKKRDI